MAEDLGGIDATLYACSSGTSARLDLDTASRGAAFAVEVRHSSARPPAAEGHALAMGRLLSVLDVRGRLPSLNRLPNVQSAGVSSTELASAPLTVPAGRCIEVSAALDRGVSGLELRLLDDVEGDEPGSDISEIGYGAHAASARMCAVKPARERTLTVELRANVGEGTALWASQIFEPDPAATGARAR
jgi:hypothetical protein